MEQIKTNIFCVYAFLDLRKPFIDIKNNKFIYKNCFKKEGFKYKFDYEPFYIGKGKIQRPRDHIFNIITTISKAKNLHLKENKFKKIIEFINVCSDDFKNIKKETIFTIEKKIVFVIKQNISENDAFELEKDLINHFGKLIDNMGPLVNYTDGGEGVSGFKKSIETLQKMSENSKKLWENKKYKQKQLVSRKKLWENEEYKQKMINCHKKHSNEIRKKITDSLKRKWQDEEYRKKQAALMKRNRVSNNKKISATVKKYYKSEKYKNRRLNYLKMKKYKIICPDGNIINLDGSNLKYWCKKLKFSVTTFGRYLDLNKNYKEFYFCTSFKVCFSQN